MDTKTILVIDDCRELLESVSMILDDAGYNVVLAMEPERAFALCSEIKFDAIICDLYMFENISEPESGSIATGLDVIWRLKEKFPTVPVIAMSGHVKAPLFERMQKMGVSGSLEKPFGRDQLLSVLEKVLKQSQS